MARIRFRLRFPEPQAHRVHVELEVDGVRGATELVMPSWTPGSYLLREFPRNVQRFAAEDAAGRALPWAKTDKGTWRVEAGDAPSLRVRYVVYAGELSVRTSHVDASHASIQGASVFLLVRGREGEPHEVRVEAPPRWHVTTPLRAATESGTWVAEGYDELVDSPLEIGTHAVFQWEVAGTPHRYAVWGRGNWVPERLVTDTTRIVLAERALFGGLPYPAYTIFLHAATGGGGLEHRDSTVLLADRWSFRGPPYERFLALVAHELFHAWNGKRIRPQGLGPFDYSREGYTRDLWVVEGITTYYTDVLLRRSGLISQSRYLERLGELVTRVHGIPGRRVQPLADASFDTWIKFYRPDADSPNSSISYYDKGALVALLLDLRIRRLTGNARSLDDVMRVMWARFGATETGYPEGTVERVAAEVAGADLSAFFDWALRGTEELEYAEELAAAGLELAEVPPPTPEVYTGLTLSRGADGRLTVAGVLADSPAQRAGVNAGDEIVALDGFRATAEGLPLRLGEKRAGETARLVLFRRDELLETAMEVSLGRPPRLAVRPVAAPTEAQRQVLDTWLRVDVPEAPGVQRAGGR